MAAQRETISIKPDASQLQGLYAAFKTLDKEANTTLRTDVSSISAWTANQIKMEAYGAQYMPAQAARVAETIKFNADRVPNVTIGGSKRNFSGGAAAGNVLYGSEFGAVEWTQEGTIGANRFGQFGGKRFPPRSPKLGKGNEGYWIYPTLRAIQGEITSRWIRAVENVLGKWA